MYSRVTLLCYRKYSSIDKRAFATDIYNAFAVISGTTDQLFVNYNTAIATIVDKHAPIITRIVTVRPKTPWHTEELSCAKRKLRRAERRWRKTRLVVQQYIYTTLRYAYRRQLNTTKASHLCTVIHEAGDNMEIMFGVTNVLLGRSTPVQFHDLHNDLALAETFHQFFIDKISNIRLAIDLRAERNTGDRQPSDVGMHQHVQLCGFTLATTTDIRRIVLQSSANSCDLNPMPTSLLKWNIDLFAPILTDTINTSLETGVVPVDTKHALVTPMLKKLTRQLPYNIKPKSCLENITTLCRQRTVPSHWRQRLQRPVPECVPAETQHGDGSRPNPWRHDAGNWFTAWRVACTIRCKSSIRRTRPQHSIASTSWYRTKPDSVYMVQIIPRRPN